MSNREIALELQTISRKQRKLYRALQEQENQKPRTRRKVNFAAAAFWLNVVLGLAFIVTNAIAKFSMI